MTRSRFLSWMASLPAAGLACRLQAQRGPGPAPIESGFLLITLEGQPDREELSLSVVNPDSFSNRQLAKGLGLTYVLAPDQSALYTVFGPIHELPSQLDSQSHMGLDVTGLSEQGLRRQVNYPPGLWPLRWSLGISPDGRSLYTFIRRLHRAATAPPPGTDGIDTDTSYYETLVLIYDTRTDNFLRRMTDGLQIGSPGDFDSARFLVGQALQFDIYSPAAGSVRRYHISRTGAAETSEAVLITQPAGAPSPVTDSPFARCRAGGTTYLIHDDGLVVVAVAGSYRTASIDPSGPGRQFLTPTISQDGRLLFVPSGSAAPGSPGCADRITVYEIAGLSKVRHLDSPRPLGPIAVNRDGSRIYAILPDSGTIAGLNAVSLVEEKLLRFNAEVKSVAVAP